MLAEDGIGMMNLFNWVVNYRHCFLVGLSNKNHAQAPMVRRSRFGWCHHWDNFVIDATTYNTRLQSSRNQQHLNAGFYPTHPSTLIRHPTMTRAIAYSLCKYVMLPSLYCLDLALMVISLPSWYFTSGYWRHAFKVLGIERAYPRIGSMFDNWRRSFGFLNVSHDIRCKHLAYFADTPAHVRHQFSTLSALHMP